MSRTWYGSLDNRLEEGRQFVDEIKVGTGVTEYLYSDRHAYEVVAVKDQKHISIRAYDHKHTGAAFDNDWELISNESNPVINLVKRGKVWYTETVVTLEDVIECERQYKENHDPAGVLWMAMHDIDAEKIKATGKPQKKYSKMNISIGRADYYFDFEF